MKVSEIGGVDWGERHVSSVFYYYYLIFNNKGLF